MAPDHSAEPTVRLGRLAGPRRRAYRVQVSDSPRMPVLFVGHGSPLNAIEDNRWSRAWRALGSGLPRPAGIVSVSAHWYVPGTFLTGNDRPETIHDFGGFPRQLYEVQYPARGDRALADRIAGLLAARRATVRDDWGLDHGTWSVLRHLRPEADVPVVQLSIDRRLPPADHLAIGRALAPLRDQRLLILASGNLTHNLGDAIRHLDEHDRPTPPWAADFDRDVAAAIEQRDRDFLVGAGNTEAGRMAHPTPDHWLPVLYAAGAADDADPVVFPSQGWDAGSLSMRSVRWG